MGVDVTRPWRRSEAWQVSRDIAPRDVARIRKIIWFLAWCLVVRGSWLCIQNSQAGHLGRGLSRPPHDFTQRKLRTTNFLHARWGGKGGKMRIRPSRCRRSPGHSPHETRRHGSRNEDTSEQPTAKMTDRPPGGHDKETRCSIELRTPIPTRPARRPDDSRSSQSRQQPPS